jgi:hypothetical protein
VRPLIASALAATLMGCSCFAPRQHAQQALVTGCMEADGLACPDEDVSAPNISSPLVLHNHPVTKTKTATAKKESPQHRNQADTRIKNAKSKSEPKTDISSSVQAEDKSKYTPSPITEAKTETPQSSPLDDIRKAKAAIAAKVKNPNVEFVETMRGTEKDADGKSSVDIVCGHIRQENAEIPFIYIVQKDEAYIGEMIGTTEAYKYLATCLVVGGSTPQERAAPSPR